MATFVSDFQTLAAAQADYTAFADSVVLTLGDAAGALEEVSYNLESYDVVGPYGDDHHLSASLTNGDTFSLTGSNLATLTYPKTITQIDYYPHDSAMYVTVNGMMTLASEDADLTGVVNHLSVGNGFGIQYTTIDFNLSQNIASDTATLSKIVMTEREYGEISGKVVYTGDMAIGASGEVTGTITGISAQLGGHSATISGLSLAADRMPTSNSLDDFLTWALRGSDTVKGSESHNELSGYAGDDSILGLAGFDTLTGAGGADTLRGGDSSDELHGGVGHDVLTGGRQADRFVFEDAPKAADSDVITDFRATDYIILDGERYAPFGTGVGSAINASRYFESADVDQLGATKAGQRILYDTDSGNLYYDPDGSGTKQPILLAVLDGHPDLSVDDIRTGWY